MDMFKIKGLLGNDTIEEMDHMNETELKDNITQASAAMKQVKEELEGNEKYQQAKQAVKDLGAGKRDVDKRQKGKVQYALHRLEELGKMGLPDRHSFERAALKFRAEQRAKAEALKAKEIRAAVKEAREALAANETDGVA